MSEKYQYFNGLKFTRDDKTGYYLDSTIRKRIHIYVWEFYNGKVPDGCEIHHKDLNKSNNDISNLQCLTVSEHKKIHADLLTEEQREWRKNNLNKNARPKACEWHKSEKGREWHKEHMEELRERGVFTKTIICTNCGKEYRAEKKNGKNHFCSGACASQYRRKTGVDSIEKVCPICGNKFMTNKYRGSITCGRSCGNKLKWRKKHESKVS